MSQKAEEKRRSALERSEMCEKSKTGNTQSSLKISKAPSSKVSPSNHNIPPVCLIVHVDKFSCTEQQ